MNILKKWWFWVIVAIIIGSIVYVVYLRGGTTLPYNSSGKDYSSLTKEELIEYIMGSKTGLDKAQLENQTKEQLIIIAQKL